MRVVLGVTGGIASYKSCELVRRLKEGGHDVWVVPTKSALNFVGEPTWAALSGNPVHTDLWAEAHHVPHIELADTADLVLVAPATANTMARLTYGLADDMLTSLILATSAPVVLAPAMHTQMWLNPATQSNVATLRNRGLVVLDPAEGALTGKDVGIGRMPEPAEILASVEIFAATTGRKLDLAGQNILITAGGTREPIDPVRFVGNHSTGLQGFALARVAALAGAKVTVVAANVSLTPPAGVHVVSVATAAQMAEEVNSRLIDANTVICAAAVADFAPDDPAKTKLKRLGRQGLVLELAPTVDVLAGVLKKRRDDQVVVGFAAETAAEPERLLSLGIEKLQAKGCDWLVVNDVSAGQTFGAAENQGYLLGGDGQAIELALASKDAIAVEILSNITKSVLSQPINNDARGGN